MSDRPTPETDDQPIINAINDNGYQVPCVDIKFARKLERERDEAEDRLASEKATRNHIIKRAAETKSERDECEEKIEQLRRGVEYFRDKLIDTERERDKAREIVKAYQEYTKLLGDEINDTAAVAYVHGWRTNRYEEGKVLREKIKQLEETK